MGDKDELPFDLKNDIKIAFDLFKNENNKITKLKLRTLLFSFIMFKSSASDINKYIEEKISPTQQLFELDDVYDLIKLKLREAKMKEANELLNFVSGNNSSDIIKESDLSKAFQKYKIDISDKEVKEMFMYMNEDYENENDINNSDKKDFSVSTEKFKNFYIDNQY